MLIFYPGDETPVCRKQLCELRDSAELLRARNAVAFGINPQGTESHKRFHANRAFNFPLLSDPDGSVCRSYRAHGLVTVRTVYGIDGDGVIRFARRGRPGVVEALDALAELPASQH